MGKIKDGDVTLTIPQVCDRLQTILSKSPSTQQALNSALQMNFGIKSKDNARTFAHAALDSYKRILVVNDDDEEAKKLVKHLMEKYMKSDAVTSGEVQQAYGKLVEAILERGS